MAIEDEVQDVVKILYDLVLFFLVLGRKIDVNEVDWHILYCLYSTCDRVVQGFYPLEGGPLAQQDTPPFSIELCLETVEAVEL